MYLVQKQPDTPHSIPCIGLEDVTPQTLQSFCPRELYAEKIGGDEASWSDFGHSCFNSSIQDFLGRMRGEKE